MYHIFATASVLAIGSALAAAWFPPFPADEIPTPDVAPVVEIPTDATDRVVDLAICLDTSGSMDDLIDSAKQKLWAIVNDLALAEPTPRLRVAILTFGNDGHDAERGWVNIDVPLTEDLDLVSQTLFAFSTNGGTELVGRVVQASVDQLEWHPSSDTLKLMMVAGNESANQDTVVNYLDAAGAAINHGIIVNAIYCGDGTDTIAPEWQHLARRADGQFAAIDKSGTVVIETPFDASLLELSTAVNGTYLPIGAAGAACWLRQTEQDANAAQLNSAAGAARAQTKASALYQCGSWDLVDASRDENFDLAKLADEDFPEAMRTMDHAQRVGHIATMGERRVAVQKRITETNTQRTVWIQTQMREAGLDDAGTFDAAIRNAIREQASARGFRFADSEEETTPVDAGVATRAQTVDSTP